MTQSGAEHAGKRDAKVLPGGGRFERTVLPHVSAGFTLARYLTGNAQDAEDSVQEAILRAMRYFHTLREEDARPWFLAIVRRVCITSYNRSYSANVESFPLDETTIQLRDSADAPDATAQRALVRERVRQAVDQLSPVLREVIVLRELQYCSYNDIAVIAEVPIGTVMSRLARARERLAEMLQGVVDVGDLV